MFCKRMAAIHQKGRDHLEALREAHRAESERLLGVLGDVLSAVREATVLSGGGQDLVPAADTEGAAGRLVLKTLERADGVAALSAAHEAVAAHHGNDALYTEYCSLSRPYWTPLHWSMRTTLLIAFATVGPSDPPCGDATASFPVIVIQPAAAVRFPD